MTHYPVILVDSGILVAYYSVKDPYSNVESFVKFSGPQTPNPGGFERIDFSRIISHCYIINRCESSLKDVPVT